MDDVLLTTTGDERAHYRTALANAGNALINHAERVIREVACEMNDHADEDRTVGSYHARKWAEKLTHELDFIRLVHEQTVETMRRYEH